MLPLCQALCSVMYMSCLILASPNRIWAAVKHVILSKPASASWFCYFQKWYHHSTCYPTCHLELHCPWINQPVVDHNGIVTGQAPGSAMLFSLVVLKVLAGEQVVRKVARGMVFDF